MAEALTVSSAPRQSSLLLPRSGPLSRSPKALHLPRPRSFGGFTARSGLAPLHYAIRAAESQKDRPFQGFSVARASSGSNKSSSSVDSVVDAEDSIQPDSTGGGGGDKNSGGSGSGGGGGGEGGSEESEGEGKKKKKGGGMSMSQKLTLGYAALVGVGGVMGYVKGGSQKSLAAGGLSALLLFYVHTQLPSNPTFASALGLGVSAALLGVMGSRFRRSGKVFPAGVVSAVSLVMTGGYLHGILRGIH